MPGQKSSVTRQLHAWRDILGVPVAVMTMRQALDVLVSSIIAKRHTPVAFLNANNANLAREKPELKLAFNHFMTLPDGIGVDLASLVLHGAMFPENLNGTDLVPKLLLSLEEPVSVALIGAKPEVALMALEAFKTLCPRHAFSLIADGYFKPEDEPAILARIEAARPDILLVAMGVPRQELWIAEAITEKHCTVPIAVGALFDIFTGSVPRAPDWMLTLRVEWIYRLWREPRRLWRRYLIGNPVFLGSIIAAKLSGTSSARGSSSADSSALNGGAET